MSELIKIDIDRPFRVGVSRWRPRKIKRVKWILAKAAEMLRVQITVIDIKRSRKGIHIVAEVTGGKELAPAEIVAIQAAAGSDPLRELLNLHRIREGWGCWNVMFTEKEEYRGKRRLKGKSSRERHL